MPAGPIPITGFDRKLAIITIDLCLNDYSTILDCKSIIIVCRLFMFYFITDDLYPGLLIFPLAIDIHYCPKSNSVYFILLLCIILTQQ